MYYEKVNFLPKIPEKLIDDLNTIQTFENTRIENSSFIKKYGKEFSNDFTEKAAVYKAPKKLYEFLQSYFDYKVKVRYQVIKKALGSHCDATSDPIKFNYILDTGGNVKTRWWNDVAENATDLLFEVESEPLVWHSLNVWKPHSITCPSRPRISITIVKE